MISCIIYSSNAKSAFYSKARNLYMRDFKSKENKAKRFKWKMR